MPNVLSKLLWLIGAILLIWVNNQVLGYSKVLSQQTGDSIYGIAGTWLVAFWSGAYLVLLGGLRRRKPIHKPLFFLGFLPCLLLSILPYTYHYLPIGEKFFYELIQSSFHMIFFSLASGFTLMLSLCRFQP